jgi:LacI family transcriptional regulator
MAARRVNLNDVSRLAQVSTATVSYVLNGTKPVREATRQRVLAAVEELGYVPDVRARSLKSRRIQIIALLFPYTEESVATSRYFRDIISSVCATAGALDYKVIVSLLSRQKSLENQINEIRLSRMAGGLILAGPSLEEVQSLSKTLEGFPSMLLSATSSDATISYIDVDNRGGMHQAVEHLVKLGHQRIAYVTPANTDSHAVQRLEAYQEAMVAQGLADQIWICEVPIKEDVSPLACLLEHHPTAVIAFDDFRALQVYSFLTRRGFQIPGDISLIGFDDEEFGQHMSPRLTTVPQPFTQMGVIATQQLIDRIENPAMTAFKYVFPMQLLPRESCGAHPANDSS